MAEKRKHTVEGAVNKASNKRSKIDQVAKKKISKPEKNGDKENVLPDRRSLKPKSISILSKEQPAFPRGGADVLSPLERKQIQARAERDAVKEFKKSQDLFGDDKNNKAGSSEDEDEDEETSKETPLPSKSKGSRKRAKSNNQVVKDPKIKIRALSYKSITNGSLILGQITAISNRDITIALPNNLVGYVPITAVSPQLNQKLQQLLNGNDVDEEGSKTDQGDEEDVELTDYFRVGQLLRVSVTSTGDVTSTNSSSRKRLQLSIEPSATNVGLNTAALTSGVIIQAAIHSIEDHGLVVDLGLENENIRGFIPKNALPEDLELSKIKTGSVFLTQVTGIGSNGKAVKLSAKLQAVKGIKNAPSVDSFVPGSLAEILITEVSESGLAGKIMGMVDATADVLHSGLFNDKGSFLDRYQIGKRIRGRIICNFPLSDERHLGFSVLPGLVDLESSSNTDNAQQALQLSAIIDDATVISVQPGLGLYLSLDDTNVGFAHISRLSDTRSESISETSGLYKLGPGHKIRIMDFNPIDGLYIVSLQKSILDQQYLRIEDVKVGEIVKGNIERLLLGESGVQGILVKLSDNVTGMVPNIYMSDVILQHPEKKFREGQSVTARVISSNPSKRQLRLTLKKTLVNSDQRPWLNFEDIAVGDSTAGTLLKVESKGAIVQFFGPVKGYLPVSEMSEAYIKDATEHFRVGQTVIVNALSVDPQDNRLTVSCRDVNSTSPSMESVLSSISPGTLVRGTVFEKSQNDILMRLKGSDAIARLTLDHISDGSLKKRQSLFEKIRVGQHLENILILDVQVKRRLVIVTNKQSLIDASQSGKLIKTWDDVHQNALGTSVTGFVSNITSEGIFVTFAAGITGLISRRQIPSQNVDKLDFGVTKFQTITAQMYLIDNTKSVRRFWLSMQDLESPLKVPHSTADNAKSNPPELIDPVDTDIKSIDDFTPGRTTKARITSVKASQLNVELAKGIQGRVDVSEIFDKWDDIEQVKRPLQKFTPNDVISVKILGAHDTRNHRFLPLTHRSSKNIVYELSAKPSLLDSAYLPSLTLEDMEKGSSWTAFVNNFGEDCLWVSISPNVRGRIRIFDLSDDLSAAADLERNFPIGSALQVRVLGVDSDMNRLDLTARAYQEPNLSTIEDLSKGLIISGRVTRVSDRNVLVQLSENLVGAVDLIDMEDDYSSVDPTKYSKNDIIKVCVVDIDQPNKKISLSARPSKVLSSSLPVIDPEITSIEQLEIDHIYRGFIVNITDKGVFVILGHGITAFVRVSNLSDTFLKEWKDHFQRDQLLRGKLISIDKASGHIQMSLKDSVMKADYKPPLTFDDVKVGDIFSGKVAKVESFGVFVLVDNSENVRGLCHRSEIAEQRIVDASKIFNENDIVKVKVLKVDPGNRRINFGMKASYFTNPTSDTDADQEMLDAGSQNGNETDDSSGGISLEGAANHTGQEVEQAGMSDDFTDNDGDVNESHEDQDLDDDDINDTLDQSDSAKAGLNVGGFDWYGISEPATKLNGQTNGFDDEDGSTNIDPKIQKKRKRRAEIQVDRTGDLDANGPQSIDDYERLLLGEPDSSLLWLQYMAFHLELGEVDQARQIGERALKSIGLGQDAEKMNVWMAMLNLENAYGDEETIDTTFKRACEFNDAQEIHSRLTSIYIQSGKPDEADELFQQMLKKFGQKDPKTWINYATFLFNTTEDAEKARSLLSRALQMLPKFTHFDLTLKFAQLEFKTKAGLPERGRTIFEGLITAFPKRIDLFNVLLDLELKMGNDNEDQIRGLFERIVSIKRLKPKQAKYFFKRWMAYEEQQGDERKVEDVQAKAAAWLRVAGKQD